MRAFSFSATRLNAGISHTLDWDTSTLSSTRKLDLYSIIVAIVLIITIIGTLGYILVSNDVIAKISFRVTQASRMISRGSYFSNITFDLTIIVNSSDIAFPLNMTRPVFVLTVEPPFYFFGDATIQKAPIKPSHQLSYSLAFIKSTDPVQTDNIMNKSNELEIEMYGLASAGFSQLQISRILDINWVWQS